MALIRSTFTTASQDDTRAPEQWLEQLCAGDSALRREAAMALGLIAGCSQALIAQLDQETHASVIEALIGALAHQADEAAVLALIDCIRSEDASLRNDAIEALKSAGAAQPHLIQQALNDSDSDVRILAVGILETLRHPEVELWLIELLEQETHVNVCACAIDVLCEVGSARALDVLELCRERFAEHDYLVFSLELALKRLQAESSS